MTSKTTDSSPQGARLHQRAPLSPQLPRHATELQVLPQGDNAVFSGPLGSPRENQGSRAPNQVFKSGPLFISSKGIGWTSWKKRWFILTRTSLVFFRNDPSITPQKVGETNLTLGGIDLNNSASVEVKVDKKLLTVFFPDGRDGRAFTLKAETLEDLQEWKTALENAVQLAPSATQVAGQNGFLKNEQADNANGSVDQQKDKPPATSMVIGRPILLALEDIDGSPSFLEKALRFIEDHGVKVEGILRQAADVDHVHHRVREYEQGKTEFTPEEDAHVIADCIKYILRELPSSPVPASCCNALLEAFRSDRNNRLNAMRTAILETFPEPNMRLLQRILLMMQTVASNQAVNRMSTSAVAACMSPLLLRPLLAGDCELENTHMDVAGDGSFQLLQAAAAANHAQAIIITLLDEYDNIFGEGSMSGLFSDSEESGTETEEATDDGTYDDDEDDDEYIDDDDDDDDDDDEYASDDHDGESGDHDEETDDDYEHSVTETCSGSDDHAESDSNDEKASRSSSFAKSPQRTNNHMANRRSPSSSPLSPAPRNDKGFENNPKKNNDSSVAEVDDIGKSRKHNIVYASSGESASSTPRLGNHMSSTKLLGTSQIIRPRWGRTSAKKNLSMESIDFSFEDEYDDDKIQRLEATKIDLQNRIAEEANGNKILQASLERRKKALHERRLALEKDVNRLQEQLQKEKDLRAALEAGSKISQLPSPSDITEKEFALEEENFNNLKQRFDDLGAQLNHQHGHNAALLLDREIELECGSSHLSTLVDNKDHEMKGSSNHIERSTNDDGHRNYSVDGDNRDFEWNNESFLSNKNQNHTNDLQAGHPKFGKIPSNSSSSDASIPKPIPSTSRKSSAKGEGSSSTSALSKLTNRLNFLKERRNQIASELQNIDKTKGSSNQPALSPGKGKAPELPIIPNQDDNTRQISHQSSAKMSKEADNNNKDNSKKRDKKKSSNSKSDAPSSFSSGKAMSDEGEKSEGDNRDSNKKKDDKRGSYSRSDATSSYSLGSNEGDKIEDDNKRNNDKRSSNSRLDATSSYNSEKWLSNEGDNKDSNKHKDDRSGSNARSDAPSAYSSGKGMSTEGEKTEGGTKDSSKKKDDKKGSTARSDAASSYSSAKEMSNEGDNKSRDKKDDKKESNKKTKNKDDNKKGYLNSENDSCPWQNANQGRKSENQSSQHLDRMKSEGQASRSSDKGRQQDSQHSSTSRTLSK